MPQYRVLHPIFQGREEVGAYPALSFKDTVPHLSSLVLHNFVLDPMISDVVAFILRHKATLAHLELHNASIDGGEDAEFPRPWHAVFTLFEAELTCLKTFVLTNDGRDPDADDFERDPRFAYTMLSPGHGYMNVQEEVDGEERDLPALESLMAVVLSRG
ncbi:hypothetical protein C8R44DRAFT_887460 [Mycena epipterygia]|nr:hypothetical protein C8R44DRAFT_887460 [Mycena epipterygia]